MKHLLKFLVWVSLCSVAIPVFAQDEDVTKLYRKKDLEQLEQYEDGDYLFPPRPKANWAIGAKGGLALLYGDVRPENSWGAAVDVRRGLGHAFSLRLQGAVGQARGQSFKPNSGYQNHSGNPWNNAYFVEQGGQNNAPNVFYNYRMNYGDVSIQALLNMNNVNFYKEESQWSIYAGAGIGLMGYHTKQNVLNGDSIYDFSSVELIDINEPTTAGIDGRSARLTELRSLMDDTFESQAEFHRDRNSIGLGANDDIYTLNFMAVGVLGARYRLGRRVELELEYRLVAANDDLLDGQRWQETGGGSGTTRLTPATNAWDALSNITLGIHFRLGKGVESPWWTNPLTQLYSDVSKARQTVDMLTKDGDGDGVPDYLDEEPDTPEGVPVTVRGTAMDSDKDGYTDDIDEEPFSPKGCDVDAYGVALDADNDRVPDCYDKEPNSPPGMYYDVNGVAIRIEAETPETPCLMPIIHFELDKDAIRPEFYPEMYYIAQVMKNDPDLKVRAVGFADVRNSPEYNLALSRRRVENAVNFIVDTYGVSEGRFMMDFKGESDPLIDGLPQDGGNNKLEPLYYVNRRVEFECVKE